jgi:hypothetical protein
MQRNAKCYGKGQTRRGANMTTTNRAPLLVLSAIGVMIVVMVLFATAMEAGVGMMILLVACIVALCLIGRWFASGISKTVEVVADKRLASQAESNRHIESVLKMGYAPKVYTPVQIQSGIAPAQPQIAAPVDPRRDKALRLLNETIESDIKDKGGALRYGPKSGRIMTQADAGAVGIIADDWSAAVAYLFAFGVATGNSGTIILDKRNVSRLIADVARNVQDAEASGVMAIPETRR